MQNEAFINDDGIIEQKYVGPQTRKSIEDYLIKKTFPLVEELQKRGHEIKILIDLVDIGKPDAGARKVALETLKTTLDYEKIAVYTDNVYIKYLAMFVIKASGNENKTKVFNSREKAVEWLKQ